MDGRVMALCVCVCVFHPVKALAVPWGETVWPEPVFYSSPSTSTQSEISAEPPLCWNVTEKLQHLIASGPDCIRIELEKEEEEADPSRNY